MSDPTLSILQFTTGRGAEGADRYLDDACSRYLRNIGQELQSSNLERG